MLVVSSDYYSIVCRCVCSSRGVVMVVIVRVKFRLMMLLFIVLFSVSFGWLIVSVCVLIVSFGNEVVMLSSSSLVVNGLVLKCWVRLEMVLMMEFLFSVSSSRLSRN